MIEAADSSVRHDWTVKLRAYALARVPECWIVDINGRVIEVFTEPVGDGHGQKRIARVGERIEAVAVDGLGLVVVGAGF